MSRLTAYRKKRKPVETTEPMHETGESSELIFVVQKHQASHLHYDVRFALDGVLISWAIPKGPPLNAKDKRLAIKVEDHPYAYKDFAGEIPHGNYGAGIVTIWDSGRYLVSGADSLSAAKRRMRAGLKKGHIIIFLDGKRLKGEFHLVRTAQEGQENTWLFFQKTSGKQVPGKRPTHIAPMLAHLVDKPFNRKEWIFEVKWDGYRTIADITQKKTRLISRNQKSFNKQFVSLLTELKPLEKHEPILDGEVVVLDSLGRSRFQLLQNFLRTREGNLIFYVFDLLYCDGQDLRDRPLLERKERLEVLLAPLKASCIRYSDHIEEKGVRLFKEVQKLDLEGIVAKNAQSSYQMKRSRDWQKIKSKIHLEVVIGGFTPPRNSREHFGSLMVGIYNKKNELAYIGQVGSGFSDVELGEIGAKLVALVTKRSPFESHPKLDLQPTYVKPVLVCEVSFSEWTDDGLMRHPVFEGLLDAHKP